MEFLYGNVVCMESITITAAEGGDLASLQNRVFFCFIHIRQFSFFNGMMVSQVCTLVI